MKEYWTSRAGQALLLGWSIVLCVCGGISWMAAACLGVLNLCLFLSLSGRCPRRLNVLVLSWVGSGTLAALFLNEWVYAVLYPYRPGIFLLLTPLGIAGGLCLASRGKLDSSIAIQWRELSFFWFVAGELLLITMGYFQDQDWLFFGVLLSLLATLILSKKWFRVGTFGVQAINTLILLVVGLPLADLFVRLHFARMEANPAGHIGGANAPSKITAETAHFFYSYDDANGEPEKFAAWWMYYVNQYTLAIHDFTEPWPGHDPNWRLRPSSHALLDESPIVINSRGFRGREIAVPKGNVYRIVCLGESTTFGLTFRKEDIPWPVLLEQMINRRLHLSRPVEVINAGIPAWSLSNNVQRLVPEILPLQPDMIISYHGYNGFTMIDKSLPPLYGPEPPPYPKRPLRLLAELEYRRAINEYLRQSHPSDGPPPPVPPMQTDYANCYRQLIAFARTNHIRLALANYCMAINNRSSQKVIDFYNAFGPGVIYARAGVNSVHSQIVHKLAEENSGVYFIDTHPGLDGVPGKFVDIIHLTQEGRRQMAENMFASIRGILESNIGSQDAVIGRR